MATVIRSEALLHDSYPYPLAIIIVKNRAPTDRVSKPYLLRWKTWVPFQCRGRNETFQALPKLWIA